ncbi:hypothetical protein [Arthrobacter sp. CG_A4]|uniref:hypothetical protein n=1 Tax=Arthrobacter sp. CG_A4 TaxID=3071706 RepID=UPI002E0FFB6F
MPFGIGVLFQRGEIARCPLVAVVIDDPDVADELALVTRPGLPTSETGERLPEIHGCPPKIGF